MEKLPKFLLRSAKLYVFLLIISTALILFGTLFPVDHKIPKSFLGYDKVVHFLMFGSWTFFYGIVRFFKGKLRLFPVLALGTLFGLLVEILQHYLPTNRSFELMDFTADIAGTLAAVAFLYILSQKIPWFKNNRTDSR